MVDKQRKKAAKQNKLNRSVQDTNESTLEISGHERGQQQEMAPGEAITLLLRIRRDRVDVEHRLERVKDYITRTADAMTKLKDKPEMADKYRRLSAARAELVRNAVSLRQLQERLSSSENRAMELIGENELANLPMDGSIIEGASETNENTSNTEVQRSTIGGAVPDPDNTANPSGSPRNEGAGQETASISVGERAQLEKRSQLVQKIVETERRTHELEAKRKHLDQIKQDLRGKIAETRAARVDLQRQVDIKKQNGGPENGHELSEAQALSDDDHEPVESETSVISSSTSSIEDENQCSQAGDEPSEADTQLCQQNQTLESLNSRLATLHSISESSSTDGSLVTQLKDRLQYLDAFRRQMNDIIGQIEELKSSTLRRKAEREDGNTSAVTGDAAESTSQADTNDPESAESSATVDNVVASGVTDSGSTTTADEMNRSFTDESRVVKETKKESDVYLEGDHVEFESDQRREKLRNLEADKEQLKHLKQLSEQLEEKKLRGEKLAQTSPEQLAQLIAASSDIQQQSDSFQSRTDAVSVVHGLQQAQRTINAVTEFTKK